MEPCLQVRHEAVQESPVLADTVAAHRRLALSGPSGEEFQRGFFGLAHADITREHPVPQTGFAMVPGVPGIHGLQLLAAVRNCEYGALRQFIQIVVGDDGRDFKD